MYDDPDDQTNESLFEPSQNLTKPENSQSTEDTYPKLLDKLNKGMAKLSLNSTSGIRPSPETIKLKQMIKNVLDVAAKQETIFKAKHDLTKLFN